MKSTYVIFCLIAMGTCSASATSVWLENGGKTKITTGDRLDKIKAIAATVPVIEIPGLFITAQTAADTQEINALSKSFGVIDKTNPNDNRSCFEKDEAVVFSFDQAVHLAGIDFNHFDKEEQFALQIGETKHVITYESLSNKSSDLYTCDLTVPAGTDVRLSVASATSKIGLDALNLDVIDATLPEKSDDKKGLFGPLR